MLVGRFTAIVGLAAATACAPGSNRSDDADPCPDNLGQSKQPCGCASVSGQLNGVPWTAPEIGAFGPQGSLQSFGFIIGDLHTASEFQVVVNDSVPLIQTLSFQPGPTEAARAAYASFGFLELVNGGCSYLGGVTGSLVITSAAQVAPTVFSWSGTFDYAARGGCAGRPQSVRVDGSFANVCVVPGH